MQFLRFVFSVRLQLCDSSLSFAIYICTSCVCLVCVCLYANCLMMSARGVRKTPHNDFDRMETKKCKSNKLFLLFSFATQMKENEIDCERQLLVLYCSVNRIYLFIFVFISANALVRGLCYVLCALFRFFFFVFFRNLFYFIYFA